MRNLLLSGFFSKVGKLIRRGLLSSEGWGDPFTSEDLLEHIPQGYYSLNTLDVKIPKDAYAAAQVPEIPDFPFAKSWVVGSPVYIPQQYSSEIAEAPSDPEPVYSTRAVEWEYTGESGGCRYALKVPPFLVVCGTENNKAVMKALDASTGEVLVDYSYDGTNFNVFAFMDFASDGDILVCGVANSTPGDELGRDAVGDGLVAKFPPPVLGTTWEPRWIHEYFGASGRAFACIRELPATGNYVVVGQRPSVNYTRRQSSVTIIDADDPENFILDDVYVANADIADDRTSWFDAVTTTDEGFICLGGGYEEFDGHDYGGINIAWFDRGNNLLQQKQYFDPDGDGIRRNFEGRGLSGVKGDYVLGGGFETEGYNRQYPMTRDIFMWEIPIDYSSSFGDYNTYSYYSGAGQDNCGDIVQLDSLNLIFGYAQTSVETAKDLWLLELEGGTLVNQTAFPAVGDDFGWCVRPYDEVNPTRGYFICADKNGKFYLAFVK